MQEEGQVVREEGDEEETLYFFLDPEAEEVDLNHHRIKKIENFNPLVKVKNFCLRWNLIKKIENLSELTTLTTLDLSDNQITTLENLESLVNLE